MQLNCLPQGLCSWDYRLVSEAGPIGSTRMNWASETGVVEIGGASHEVVKDGVLSGRWCLKAGDAEADLLTAEKPSAFSSRLLIAHGEKTCTLQKSGWVGRSFELLEDERQRLRVEPRHAFTRRGRLWADDALELAVVGFAFWLVAMTWRRAARSSSGGAGGAGGGG